MTIRVTCPNPDCQKSLKTSAASAGKRCRCPRCRTAFRLPAKATSAPSTAPAEREMSHSPATFSSLPSFVGDDKPVELDAPKEPVARNRVRASSRMVLGSIAAALLLFGVAAVVFVRTSRSNVETVAGSPNPEASGELKGPPALLPKSSEVAESEKERQKQAAAEKKRLKEAEAENERQKQAAAEKEIESEKERLKGTWACVSLTSATGLVNGGDLRWVFDDEKLTTVATGKKNEVRYFLDPSRSPKWMDLDAGGGKMPLLYALQGNELTVCQKFEFNKAMRRPVEIASPPGTKFTVIRFNRESGLQIAPEPRLVKVSATDMPSPTVTGTAPKLTAQVRWAFKEGAGGFVVKPHLWQAVVEIKTTDMTKWTIAPDLVVGEVSGTTAVSQGICDYWATTGSSLRNDPLGGLTHLLPRRESCSPMPC